MDKEDDQEKKLPQDPESSPSKSDEDKKPVSSGDQPGSTGAGGLKLSLSKQEPIGGKPPIDESEEKNETPASPPLAGNLAPGAQKPPAAAPRPVAPPPPIGEKPASSAPKPPAPGGTKPPPPRPAGPPISRPPAGPPPAGAARTVPGRPAGPAGGASKPAPASTPPVEAIEEKPTVSAGALIIDLLAAAASIAFAVLLYLKL